MRIAGTLWLAVILVACRTTPVRQAAGTATLTRLFGPVVGAEVIGGRADVGAAVLLLAGGLDLVRVDVAAGKASRTHLVLSPGESCWGLARLANGTLWTLKGRHTMARVNEDGSLAEQIALAAPHFNLFAAGDRLLYQEAEFVAPRPALLVASADGAPRVPWSAIMTRRFEGLARASAAALNMLACGGSRTGEHACWFPDEPIVYLVDDRGTTRRVVLAGLKTVPPEVLLTSDNPARAVRDAYIASSGDILVLSTGDPPVSAADAPGGWLLARYGPHGEPRRQARLSEPARLILGADAERVFLVLSNGAVGEARLW